MLSDKTRFSTLSWRPQRRTPGTYPWLCKETRNRGFLPGGQSLLVGLYLFARQSRLRILRLHPFFNGFVW